MTLKRKPGHVEGHPRYSEQKRFLPIRTVGLRWARRGRCALLSGVCAFGWAGMQGCGSGAPTIPEELLACCGGGMGGGAEPEDYPPGPYGTQIGATLENLAFQGIFDPSAERELGAIEFSDFYDPSGQSDIQLILLNTAAVWCQPCQIEHLGLPERVRQWGPRGLAVVSLLFQDENGDPAKTSTLETWVDTFDTNFAMALDPSYQMGRYGPSDTPPLNLVVDPRDMTILARFVGNQEGPMWQFIERQLDAQSDR